MTMHCDNATPIPPLPQSTKVVAKFRIGVRILFMRVQGVMLFVGLSSGSVVVINLQEVGATVLACV